MIYIIVSVVVWRQGVRCTVTQLIPLNTLAAVTAQQHMVSYTCRLLVPEKLPFTFEG